MDHAYAEGVALGVEAQLAAPRRATSPSREEAWLHGSCYAEGQAVGVRWLAVNGDGATQRGAEGSDAEGERAPSA
jgi:hypothetical protein